MTIRKFKDFEPNIHNTAYVDEDSIIIGDVNIGAESSIWPMTVARGDVQKIVIGERTNVQDGSILHVTSDNTFTPGGTPLLIGNDVTIGHGAMLHACTIKNKCLIGIGSIILDGAIIESNSMLAAGSLVGPNKIIKSGMLYKGSPAKPIRKLTEKEIEYISFSSEHYVKTMKQHIG
ncbi:gamma carbonic anhydrase family protein [Gammaproteobacteria bacterium]|nr:gamma carbonic anhydrase family protein [Gammaproteobacteria bacterium]